MVDIIEIYVHWYAGRSKSQVSASLEVDHGEPMLIPTPGRLSR